MSQQTPTGADARASFFQNGTNRRAFSLDRRHQNEEIKMASVVWQSFFPFQAHDKFDIDSNDAYSGDGKVLKADATTLELSVDVSAFLLPAFEGKIEIEYLQEGAGNRVKIMERHKKAVEDKDAEIKSDLKLKTRIISAGKYRIELSKTDSNEAKLVVKNGSKTMRLILEKC